MPRINYPRLCLLAKKTFLVVLLNVLFIPLPGCDWIDDIFNKKKEFDYYSFAEALQVMLSNPSGFETYAINNQLAEDQHFFTCLDFHRERKNNDALALIAACDDRCDGDAVCNFNCNNDNGTEFIEGFIDLMDILKSTVKGQTTYSVLEINAQAYSELTCFAVNSIRDLQGLSQLSCQEVWGQLEEDNIEEYACRLKE